MLEVRTTSNSEQKSDNLTDEIKRFTSDGVIRSAADQVRLCRLLHIGA